MKRLTLLFLAAYIGSGNCFTLPAGLRPAKALGEHSDVIIPEKTVTEHTLKEPTNLSLRSRMLAALSAATKESDGDIKTAEDSKKSDQSQTEQESTVINETTSSPLLILTKSGKKIAVVSKPPLANTEPGSTVPSVVVKHSKITTTNDGKRPGTINFGLNTVLHTNLVDSKGRIMKGVNSVPIKVSTSMNTDMKSSQTSHSASQVESEAEKVVPIKFGSS
uniref:Secreted protein n=1 Tax=Syphacia muris TaxID=451379 RepID=A0A0N5AH87_9BILA